MEKRENPLKSAEAVHEQDELKERQPTTANVEPIGALASVGSLMADWK